MTELLKADDILYFALAVANCILGTIMAYTQFRFWRSNGHEHWTWIKLLLGCMGVYWSAIYAVVILAGLGLIPSIDPVYFGRIFIRPAITLSLGLCAAGSFARWKVRSANK